MFSYFYSKAIVLLTRFATLLISPTYVCKSFKCLGNLAQFVYKYNFSCVVSLISTYGFLWFGKLLRNVPVLLSCGEIVSDTIQCTLDWVQCNMYILIDHYKII